MKLRTATILAVLGVALFLAVARAGESAEDAFQSLFGDEMRKAQASNSPKQLTELAEKILKAAKSASADRPFHLVLCQKAYDLASKVTEGFPTAVAAMKQLGDANVEQRAQCLDKSADVYQRWLITTRGEEKNRVADAFYSCLLETGDRAAREDDWALAAKAHKAAMTLADSSRPTHKEEATARAMYSTAMQQADQRLDSAKAKLAASPADAAASKAAMTICLVDFDDPNAANAYLSGAADPHASTYVPLARQSPGGQLEAAAKELAEWYRSLAIAAGPHAKGPMLRRAKTYYQRYLALHTAADREVTKAKIALEQIEQELGKVAPYLSARDAIAARRDTARTAATTPAATATTTVGRYEPTAEVVEFARKRDALPPAQQWDFVLARLKELSPGKELKIETRVENGTLTGLGVKECTGLTSLEPLWGMKLKFLWLRDAKALKSLRGLQGMPLEELSLGGLELIEGDLSDLAGTKIKKLTIHAPRLTGLTGIGELPLEEVSLNWCRNLRADLSIFKGMALKVLRIPNCPNITGFNVIRELPLKELTLNGCEQVAGDLAFLKGMGDLRVLELRECDRLTSLAGLEGLQLDKLDLKDCKNVRDLSPLKDMKLREIILANCSSLTAITGIGGSPITGLDLGGCKNLRGDLSALKGMNINWLSLKGNIPRKPP